jgi:hypothetical protein
VQVEITGLLSVHSNFWDHGGSNIAIVLLATPVGGELRARNGETDGVAWFPWGALPELAFEGDRHVIERYFGTRNAGAPVDLNYVRLESAANRAEPPPVSKQAPPDPPLYHPV